MEKTACRFESAVKSIECLVERVEDNKFDMEVKPHQKKYDPMNSRQRSRYYGKDHVRNDGEGLEDFSQLSDNGQLEDLPDAFQ